MFVPPIFPLGVDIHERGSYSSDEKAKEKELFQKVRTQLSLEWARQAKDKVDPSELKPANVAAFLSACLWA
jgi:hypothetical protein